MKKLLRICLLLLCGAFNICKAQTLTIPDQNFVNWLNNNGYSSCLTGNQLDVNCPDVVNATFIDCSMENISDLTGIQAFVNLQLLFCNHNMLSSLPPFPPSLVTLDCSWNFLSSLPSLPQGIENIDCGFNNIGVFPNLPATLRNLYCYGNQLTYIPLLPAGFLQLSCEQNNLTGLPPLPVTMNYLDCSDNDIDSLPTLPDSLKELHCYSNILSSLPSIPPLVREMNCSTNVLTALPVLPSALYELKCGNNLLTGLPSIPASIRHLYCNSNLLGSLPSLPDTLIILDISNNPLNCLPPVKYIYNNFNWANTNINCFSDSLYAGTPNPPINNIPICSTSAVITPSSISVTGGNTKVCSGDTVIYNTPMLAGLSYMWNSPNGSIIISGQGTNSVTVVYNNAFVTAGLVSVATTAGCNVSAAKTLNVYRNIPPAPGAITGQTHGLCYTTIWSTDVYSVNPVAGMTYNWTVPQGATIVSGQGTNTIGVWLPLFLDKGIISVNAINQCGAGRKRNLMVKGAPETPSSITGPVTYCVNQQNVPYTVSLVPSAGGYYWTVPRHAVIDSGQNTNSIIVDYGDYSGYVKVRSVNMCGFSNPKILPVNITCRGGNESTSGEINIYPNPSSSAFTIKSFEKDGEFILYSITGKTIFSSSIINGEELKFGHDLPSGIYMAEIISGDEKKVVKLVKN